MTPEQKKIYMKEWRKKNKEKMHAYQKKYREENKEAIIEMNRIYSEKNKEVMAEKRKNYAKKNKNQIKKRTSEYYYKNRDMLLARQADWREKNRDLIKQIIKNWYRKNKPKVLANTTKRRAAKINRTPNWLTAEQLLRIESIYAESIKRRQETGLDWHVDHIIPLQGKLVSGLHVPENMQIILAKENVKKGNRYQL